MVAFTDKNIWEPRSKVGVEYVNMWGKSSGENRVCKGLKGEACLVYWKKEAIWG